MSRPRCRSPGRQKDDPVALEPEVAYCPQESRSGRQKSGTRESRIRKPSTRGPGPSCRGRVLCELRTRPREARQFLSLKVLLVCHHMQGNCAVTGLHRMSKLVVKSQPVNVVMPLRNGVVLPQEYPVQRTRVTFSDFRSLALMTFSTIASHRPIPAQLPVPALSAAAEP